MAIWHNTDGVPVRFGLDQGRRKQTATGAGRLGVFNVEGDRQTAILSIDLAGAARTAFTADRNNDGTMDGFEKGLDSFIPNGALVTSIEVVTTTAAAGGTSFSVGTYQVDGTVISATNLISAGTPSATAVAIAQDSYVTFSTIGTYTAGKLQVYIHYILPQAVLKP